MHPLQDLLSRTLAAKLQARKFIVWYDPRSEFAPFVRELRGGARTTADPVAVTIGDVGCRLAEYDGSMLEVRAAVEPFVSADEPERVLIYVPGCERDLQGSILMEVEKAGDCYETQLK